MLFFLFSKEFKNIPNLNFEFKINFYKLKLHIYIEVIFFNAIFIKRFLFRAIKMDYKKKSLKKLNRNESYEEIDTRLASGWYVDSLGSNKRKKYKTIEVPFKISKKTN